MSVNVSGYNLTDYSEQAFKSIVTDGLVLFLDASFPTSYPNYGDGWFDMSGNFNNGTLINGPTYSTDGGGSIVFDATNDYVNIPYNSTISLPDSYSNFTVEIATKIDIVPPATNQVVLSQAAGGGTTRTWMRYFISSGKFDTGLGGTALSLTSLTPVAGTIYVLNLKYESGTLYIGYNGAFYDSSVRTVDENATGDIRIGSNSAATQGAWWDGSVYFVRFYNRALSSAEILQNYNASKERLGL
jgi:hypothetical protein